MTVKLRTTVMALLAAAGLAAPAAQAQTDYTSWTIERWIDNAIDVKWSPDGSRVTFTRKVTIDGSNFEHIFVADGDGSNPVDLMPDSKSQNSTADWSGDGEKIVWVSSEGEAFNVGGAGGGPGVNLWVMDADGSDKTKLTTTTPGGTNYRPYWSHSGRRLFWTQSWWRTSEENFRWALHVADYVDPDGSGPDGGRLENQRTVNERDTAFYESAEWDVDDSSVLYSSMKSNSGNYELYRLDLATGDEERLTYHPELDISGHPSPDGRWIAMTSSRDDHSTWSYYTDASWDLNLPPLLDNILIITLNTAVAWLQPVNPQGTDIYLMKRDGSGVTRITQWEDQVGGGMPNWAPDGCHISTAPAIAQRIAGQRDLIDTRTQVRNAYLITFGGCPPL
jgi:Tol biopolymer transport system component